MDCKTCHERDTTPVSRGVLETSLARADYANKRQTAIIILLIILFVATNAYWIWYNRQWETVQTIQTVTQDADNGINRFVGGNYYGNEEPTEEAGLIVEDATTETNGTGEEGISDDNDNNDYQGP